MNRRYLRVYKGLDINDVKEHLLVYGDLSANCANCQAIDIKLDALKCPTCQTEFRYIAFRNVRNHLPKLHRLSEERPQITLVDYDDFSRLWGALKAENFLK